MLTGDARGQDTLHEAGIDRAITVAALTSADAVNVQIGNEARLLQKDVHIVVRVFSDSLEDQLVNLFGIGTAYSTSRLAAPAMATAALITGVRHAMTVTGTARPLYLMVEHTVAASSVLAGQTVAELRRRYDLLIVCYDRATDRCAMPPAATQLTPGDVVTLVAPLTTLAALPEFVA
jgi:Trk K+ transport system NAD-binding subunit